VERERGIGEELTCRELVELVTDYLEGALAPADRARFDEHVAGCEGCTAYLSQMRETLRLLGRLTEESVPAASLDSLLAAFRGWAR
jgi:predicted anti-sigma-YlaC factor YlaD